MSRAVVTALQKIVAVAAVGAAALAANHVDRSTASSSEITNSTKTLNVALGSDIRGLVPGVNRDENTDVVTMHMFEGLVGLRENGSVGLLLAQSLKTSPDRRRYRFQLRPGIRFSDGTPLRPNDVVSSWRWYLNPANNWLCLSGFDGTIGAKIQGVYALGNNDLEFVLDRADPAFVARMAGPECGGSAIFSRKSQSANDDPQRLIFTGPYRLSSWRRGENIILSKNPYYWGQSATTDGYVGGKLALTPSIKFFVIRDGAARLAALVKGQIDVLPSLTSAEIRQLRRTAGVTIASAPVAAINAVLIQSYDPLMSDVRMRRALALTLNLKAIAGLATAGTGTPNPSVVPAASPNHGPVQSLGYAQDIAAARRLLAAANYHGQPITLVTNRRYADQFDQALIVQAMAREAGINIKLEVVDWATQLARYQEGKYQLMSFAYSARADPVASYMSILGDRSISKRKVWGSHGAISLLKEVSETTDPIKRQQKLDALHRQMLSDVPLIVLYNNSDANAIGHGVTGFKSWMMARARFWNVSKAGGSNET